MKRADLVAAALKKASPEQLIRVRAVIQARLGKYGCDSETDVILAAVEAFDRRNYKNEDLLDRLDDEALALALDVRYPLKKILEG